MGRFPFARSEATQEMFPSEEGNRRCWLRRCGNVLARLLSRDIIETARRDTTACQLTALIPFLVMDHRL